MKHSNQPKLFTRTLLSSALISVLAACGGGGGGGASSDVASSNDVDTSTVAGKLAALGVDTTATPRVDTDGDNLPEDYAPMGSTASVNRFSEIMLFGIDADDSGVARSGNRMTVTNLIPASSNRYNWETLNDESMSNTPWFGSSVSRYDDEVRSVIDGDFDNDGIDEVVVVHQPDGEDLQLVLVQDSAEGHDISDPTIIDNNSWDDVFLTRGDYDGDGDHDLIVGMVGPAGNARLLMLENDNGTLSYNGQRIDLESESSNIRQLALSTGNIDYDKAMEFAVVANEGNNHNYYVFDDSGKGFTQLISGKVEVDNGSGSSRALVASVSLGDVDGDSIDEVVLSGSDRVGRDTQSNNTPYNYLTQVFDDADRDFDLMTEHFVDSRVGSIRQGSGDTHELDYVHVVTADINGDGAKEIVTNQFVYNSLRVSPFGLTTFYDETNDTDALIPLDYLMKRDGTSGSFRFDWDTSAFAVGDVTSDGRENIVIYSQRDTTGNMSQGLEVWGLDQIDGWEVMASYETDTLGSNNPAKAQIILPDLELDDGSATLKFSEGSHQLVFTEPLMIAALAAAPCATDLGQNDGSCRTAFGSSVSNTSAITDGWNLSAGVHAGFEAEGSLFGATAGASMMAEISVTMNNWTTSTYTTTKTVVRETGFLEDSVILSVLPIDVYTYTVMSHPDPSLVGSDVEIRMPREIITTMVTLDYYNQRIADEDKRLPENVFEHTAGMPESYPTASKKNQTLFNYTGLESDEFTTGVGQGQTIASITEFSSTSTGREYAVQAEVTISGSVGVEGDVGLASASAKSIAGFSIGGGVNSALEITRGSENLYQGSVGNISAAAFDAGEHYNWGLFSYIYDDADYHLPFEVVNYWVD